MSQVTLEQAFQLALTHHNAGRLSEAESIYRQILAALPQQPDTLHMLGVLAGQTGNLNDAVTLIRQAIALNPNNPAYYSNLGNFLQSQGQLDEALGCFQKALAFLPNLAQAHYNLGNVWRDKKQFDQAIACYRQALALDPNIAEIHYNLGNVLQHHGQLDEAIACHQRALALKPNSPETHSNLGNALKDKGYLDEALAHFRQALVLNPNYILAHDNLLYTSLFHPASDPKNLFAECQRWNRQHIQPLNLPRLPHANKPDPNRPPPPLRIGYVSPDFREHPVGRFLLSLLSSHDRSSFKIFCYADVRTSDTITEKLKSHTDTWRSILGMADDQVAELIRKDQIDILVDLAMHMDNNRLQVFARKPAPIQVTYLAYAGGTAVDAIDYRLTDRYLDPDPAEDRYYFEKSFRLTGPYWCYELSAIAPPVNSLPVLTTNKLTFGNLNNFCKVTLPTLETWAALLQKIPHSQLLISSPPGNHRDQLRQFMQARSVAPDRLDFIGSLSLNDYFHAYHKIDIALDPFPYNGGTTTCDALWMGVPVITLRGRTPVGRAGVSLLSNLGMPELIAHTPDQYIQIAADLATDLPRLTKLRATLRERMQNSPLMNAPQYARSIEQAYRTMWQTWCKPPSTLSNPVPPPLSTP